MINENLIYKFKVQILMNVNQLKYYHLQPPLYTATDWEVNDLFDELVDWIT